MLKPQEIERIQTLLRAGQSVKQIAMRTGRSTATIYNIRRTQTSIKIDKAAHENSSPKYIPAVRRETSPGEEAQVDWGSFGSATIRGKKERLYAFVYILSYSRMVYVEFVTHQNQQTLQACHMHAFNALGIPKTILYDNMKTVVLSHKRRKNSSPLITYNPAFIDFARYYNFTPRACSPYWPRSKGKVENTIKYIRSTFSPTAPIGPRFIDMKTLNEAVSEWSKNAAQRIHRTTLVRPIDRFDAERPSLAFTHNLPPYTSTCLEERYSTKDALVSYKSNLYSVPYKWARRKLMIKEVNEHGATSIIIYYAGRQIAQHALSLDKNSWIVDPNHVFVKPKEYTASNSSATQRKEGFVVEARSLTYYDSLRQ